MIFTGFLKSFVRHGEDDSVEVFNQTPTFANNIVEGSLEVE